MSANGRQKLKELGVSTERFAQNLAIDAGIRLRQGKKIDDPSFIGMIARVESDNNPDLAEKLFDLITALIRVGEITVNHAS